jgi:hypothetical protein
VREKRSAVHVVRTWSMATGLDVNHRTNATTSAHAHDTHHHTISTRHTRYTRHTSQHPRGRTVHVVNVVENRYGRVVQPGGDLLNGVGELDPLRTRAAHMGVVRVAVGA